MLHSNLWKQLLYSAECAFFEGLNDLGENILLNTIDAANRANDINSIFVESALRTARNLYDQQDYSGGERVCLQLLEAVNKAVDSNSLLSADVLCELAEYQALQEHHDDAAHNFKRCLTIRRAALGEQDETVCGTFHRLSMSLHALGNQAWEDYFATSKSGC